MQDREHASQWTCPSCRDSRPCRVGAGINNDISHQSASPLICNLNRSSSTVPCPLITVRTTHIGPRQASVLKRTALLAAQPVPQPAARMVKYGTPVAGLMGEQSVLVLPVAITPSCCSTTLKLEALVNTMAHLPAMAPMLVISIG